VGWLLLKYTSLLKRSPGYISVVSRRRPCADSIACLDHNPTIIVSFTDGCKKTSRIPPLPIHWDVMDATGERSPAPRLENGVKQDESILPSGHEEAKTTYRSFKYVFLFRDIIFLCFPTIKASRYPRQSPFGVSDLADLPSTRKKYRKMRIKFDGKMHESNILCAKEQLGADTAKRIAQENELAESPAPVTNTSNNSTTQ
jgi:hypothetical protein